MFESLVCQPELAAGIGVALMGAGIISLSSSKIYTWLRPAKPAKIETSPL